MSPEGMGWSRARCERCCGMSSFDEALLGEKGAAECEIRISERGVSFSIFLSAPSKGAPIFILPGNDRLAETRRALLLCMFWATYAA